MNSELHFSKTLPIPGTDQTLYVTATLLPEGVKVTAGSGQLWDIPWDKVEDVEHLAGLLWDLQVWRFREVIMMLAQAARARALVQ